MTLALFLLTSLWMDASSDSVDLARFAVWPAEVPMRCDTDARRDETRELMSLHESEGERGKRGCRAMLRCYAAGAADLLGEGAELGLTLHLVVRDLRLGLRLGLF